MIKYIKLFIYSFIFCCVVYFSLTGLASLFVYLTKGYFSYPLNKIKRTMVFSIITGITITVAAFVFKTIGKYESRKKPPTDPDK